MSQSISASDPAAEVLRVVRSVINDLTPSSSDSAAAVAAKHVARWSAILFVAAFAGAKVL